MFAAGRDDETLSALVREILGRPSLVRAAGPAMWDKLASKTVGDYGQSFFFASFNNFGCQTEVETGVKSNKRSVILFQQLERVHFYCIDSLPVSGNMNDRENNNEARHPSPLFLISYRAQGPAMI